MRLHEALWPNKYMLLVLGLWPNRPGIGLAQRLFVYLRIVLALFAVILLFVPHIAIVAANWGDIKILGDYGSLSVIYLLGVLKIFYYLVHQRSYNSTYEHVKAFWDSSDDPKERSNYELLARVAKLVTIICSLSGFGNMLFFNTAALATWIRNRGERLYHRPLLPIELHYGFDTQATPVYELIVVWQNVCVIYVDCAIIGGDCTMMALIFHLAGQFKLIRHRFHAIGGKINESMKVHKHHEDYDGFRSEIGRCIAQHQHTIRVAKELQALLSPLFFAQIMTSGLQICLSGYAVIEGGSSGMDFVKFFMFFLSLLVQLFVWCWPAELLMSESGAIAETIYHDMPWFELTCGQQRDLNILLFDES